MLPRRTSLSAIGMVAGIVVASEASEMLTPVLTLRAVTTPSGVNAPSPNPIQAARVLNAAQTSFGNDVNSEFFFGFLEFDWKPNAVPGFGPLSDSPSQIAIAEATE